MSPRTPLIACALLVASACSSSPRAGDDGAADGASDAPSPREAGAGPADARSPLEDGGSAGDAADGAGDGDADACAATGGTLQTALNQSLGQAQSPGAVLAVRTPTCRWVLAAGNSTPSVAMDPADVLRVGSITKTFVSTAVLRLYAAGSIALDDALEKWLPGFPNGANITLKELLNHTSGIFDYTQDATWQATVTSDPGTVWTPQQLVNIAAMHPANFAPGTSWGYSNTDYILLGMLIEKVTGSVAGAVLHQKAIDSAGLMWTTLPGYEPIKGTLARGYSTSGTDVSTLFDPSYAWTAGAMVSSAGDLADWAVQLYGGSILDATSLGLMLQGVPTGTSGQTYGLGVFILAPSLTGASGNAVGHPGDINGYHSQMFYFMNEKTAVVGMVNSDAADPNVISVAALNVLGL